MTTMKTLKNTNKLNALLGVLLTWTAISALTPARAQAKLKVAASIEIEQLESGTAPAREAVPAPA